ncbi:hypothetical protein L8106_09491 [Lyngbya sp. PCC 8106]|nr:hypothetical protein L8106_09491 [Lyngbya sp. PCC 8106]
MNFSKKKIRIVKLALEQKFIKIVSQLARENVCFFNDLTGIVILFNPTSLTQITFVDGRRWKNY